MNKSSMLVAIIIGASIGAVARYEVYLIADKVFNHKYFATIFVNILGSFIIGICFFYFSQITNSFLQTLIMTGLLGSFTTFSTFSLDAINMISSGQFTQVFLFIFSQLILGLVFCFFGIKLASFYIT